MNKVVMSGNITKDAELRFTPDGTPVSNFSIAVREYKKKEDKQTLFIDLFVWGKRAEALNQYLKKGKSILVDGRLDVTKRASDNGKTYTNIKVYVNELEFLGKKESSKEGGGDVSAGSEPAESEEVDEVPF